MNGIVKGGVVGVFVLLLAGAIGYSAMQKHSGSAASVVSSDKLVINGVITSEKETFFKDPRFIKLAADNGIEVNVENWTSDKIIQVKTQDGFGKYNDFVFPSTVQVSDKVKATFKGSQADTIFYSPMVVATRTPIVNLLDKNGLLSTHGTYKALDMAKFLNVMSAKTKWNALKDNTEYPVNKNILIYTSNAKRSGSSKMFIALASYLYNNSDIVNTPEQEQEVVPKIRKLMEAQGYRESSSADLFNDYVSIGMGKAPMIFCYESQMVELAVKTHGLQDQMQILYPSPTIFSKHVMVSLDSKGQKLMDFLSSNEDVKKIAAEYGFRVTGGVHLVQTGKTIGLDLPATVVDVVDAPSFEVLEDMVNQVETQ